MRNAHETKKNLESKLSIVGLLGAALCIALLIYALGSMPFAAHAISVVGNPAAATDVSANKSGESGAASSDSNSSEAATPADPSTYGLYAATGTEPHFLNEASINTTINGAFGLFAEAQTTIIANALTLETAGKNAIAVVANAESNISLANTQLATGNTDATLLQSAGTLEADNVVGKALKSQIARVKDSGRMLINSSSLTSGLTDAASDETMASAITLYSEDTTDASTSSTKKTALFQACGSTLESAIKSGAFFHLVNTKANIVLSDNTITFDTKKAKLLVAAGSDATSSIVSTTTKDASEFGTAGKNGATVTMTALKQSLEGAIEVDTISSLDLFLLEHSTWEGSADITTNSAGTALATNIVVNIDATSGWVVTKDSTVSRLNIEKGGKLVDEEGKAVTIVDADGNKLVDGASEIKVKVTDEFSTSVKTTDSNMIQASTIDRSAFDAANGTETAFGTNGAAGLSDEELAANLQIIITEWFHNL